MRVERIGAGKMTNATGILMNSVRRGMMRLIRLWPGVRQGPTPMVAPARASAIAAPQAAVRGRILAIDALRGVAILAMSLRHMAYFLGRPLQAETYGGQPATLLNWPHWVSGLIANITAPTFFLLVGTSLALLIAGRRRAGVSEWDITRYLLIRAGVLVLLDLTICDIAWAGFNPYTHVLLSIAIAMVILSVARFLPVSLFAALTLALLLTYQALLSQMALPLSQTENFWQALLWSYSTKTWPAVEFSILGWFPLPAMGFILGQWMSLPALRRARTWVAIGTALLGIWLVLRWNGGIGDLTPYTPNQPWHFFFIMSKTPPSLTFLTFNLGLSALTLAALFAGETWLQHRPLKWLVTCGQASLFFFVAHIVVYGALARLVAPLQLPLPAIFITYTTWLGGLVVLVPIAGAYNRLRRRHPQSILRYL
ncbi:MAG: hypothetical protein C4311_12940 [Chloroflexota bacterium]